MTLGLFCAEQQRTDRNRKEEPNPLTPSYSQENEDPVNDTLSKHEGAGQTNGKLRVFITEGSGFIGSHLTRRLADMGHTVRNFDPRANPEENILNLPKLQEAIAAFEPDLIYHLASLVGVGPTERVPGYVIRLHPLFV